MMAKHLTGLDFSRVCGASEDIARSASAAYWLEDAKGTDTTVDFHREKIRQHLDRICEIMGLRVVDAEEVSA